ncbi:MAG TPA: M28 family peptidase, partial [Segetibacter sp.]
MKICSFFLLLLFANSSYAQDVGSAKKWVDTLSSAGFWGRGYTKNGMAKAASYLAAQIASFDLKPIAGKSFFQSFAYPVNTFPGKMEVSLNGRKLVPGKEFIVSPDSRSVTANAALQQQDSTHFTNAANRIIVTLADKLTWSVAPEPGSYTMIQVDKKVLTEVPATIRVSVDSKLVPNFSASNVCAWVKGTVKPDSVIVISAHYDHLGGMGSNTYFPGANDNASGTSLLLGLAKYYAKNPAPYTMAFIAFAGEEAGLKGSKHYTDNPLFPLKNIHFLVNLDLEGTGDEGITVVNATEHPEAFGFLNMLNDEGKFLSKINARGKAANSDHYWFTEKGVPAFFLYTL